MKMPTTLEVTPQIRKKVVDYIKNNGQITNRECREHLNIEYDQAITLFNIMIEDGDIVRIGKTSNIRYVLPKKDY